MRFATECLIYGNPTPHRMPPLITTLHLTHLPATLGVHIALCRNLGNATFLRQQLLDGNPEFEYALLDASTVRTFPYRS